MKLVNIYSLLIYKVDNYFHVLNLVGLDSYLLE